MLAITCASTPPPLPEEIPDAGQRTLRDAPRRVGRHGAHAERVGGGPAAHRPRPRRDRGPAPGAVSRRRVDGRRARAGLGRRLCGREQPLPGCHRWSVRQSRWRSALLARRDVPRAGRQRGRHLPARRACGLRRPALVRRRRRRGLARAGAGQSRRRPRLSRDGHRPGPLRRLGRHRHHRAPRRDRRPHRGQPDQPRLLQPGGSRHGRRPPAHRGRRRLPARRRALDPPRVARTGAGHAVRPPCRWRDRRTGAFAPPPGAAGLGPRPRLRPAR